MKVKNLSGLTFQEWLDATGWPRYQRSYPLYFRIRWQENGDPSEIRHHLETQARFNQTTRTP